MDLTPFLFFSNQVIICALYLLIFYISYSFNYYGVAANEHDVCFKIFQICNFCFLCNIYVFFTYAGCLLIYIYSSYYLKIGKIAIMSNKYLKPNFKGKFLELSIYRNFVDFIPHCPIALISILRRKRHFKRNCHS